MENKDMKESSTQSGSLKTIIGSLLLPFCLLSIYISIKFVIVSWDTMKDFTGFLLILVLGSIILIGSVWITNLTVRLILNKPRAKTLDEQMPPWALYLVATYFIGMPIISITTGAFFENPVYYPFYIMLLPIFINAGRYYYKLAKDKTSKKKS